MLRHVLYEGELYTYTLYDAEGVRIDVCSHITGYQVVANSLFTGYCCENAVSSATKTVLVCAKSTNI